jgi:CubicO group peptidase (beta-lactamase class C family)
VRAVLGIDALPVTEVTDDALMGFNDAGVRAVGVPGGGGVSDATGLALFYQALLHNQAGVWKPDLLADVTTNVRNRLPERLGNYPINYTLGLRVAGDDGHAHMRGFGRTVSPRAFGHNGAAGQVAWADPATGLSFCYLTNGIEANTLTQGRRGVALSSIAAQTRESAQA